MRTLRKDDGFTLIELLVLIIISGLLITIAFPVWWALNTDDAALYTESFEESLQEAVDADNRVPFIVAAEDVRETQAEGDIHPHRVNYDTVVLRETSPETFLMFVEYREDTVCFLFTLNNDEVTSQATECAEKVRYEPAETLSYDG